MPGTPWVDYNPYFPRDWAAQDGLATLIGQVVFANVGGVIVGTILYWILHARGLDPTRRHVKRLTHPEPIVT
jgi:hypothetical protein